MMPSIDNAMESMPLADLLPLADAAGDHHGWGFGWGEGWWVLMAIGMVVVWAVVIAAGFWLVRELATRRAPQPPAGDSALEILDRRLARGAVSTEEYERLRQTLIRSRGGEMGPPPTNPEEDASG